MYRHGSLPSRMIRTSLKGGNIRIAPSPVAICFWRTSRISLVIDSKAAVHRAALTNWLTRISRIVKQQIYPVLSLLSHKHLLPGTSSWRFQIKDIAHAKEQAAIEDFSAPHRSGFGRTYRKSTELAASLVDLWHDRNRVQRLLESRILFYYSAKLNIASNTRIIRIWKPISVLFHHKVSGSKTLPLLRSMIR